MIARNFYDKEYASKLLVYKGLEHGNLCLTDIDAVMELRGKAFLFIEAKSNGSHMRKGQSDAYTRLADVVTRGGVDAYVLEVEWDHTCYDPSDDRKDILLRKCRIERIYCKQNGVLKWRHAMYDRTVGEFIDWFVDRYTGGTAA